MKRKRVFHERKCVMVVLVPTVALNKVGTWYPWTRPVSYIHMLRIEHITSHSDARKECCWRAVMLAENEITDNFHVPVSATGASLECTILTDRKWTARTVAAVESKILIMVGNNGTGRENIYLRTYICIGTYPRTGRRRRTLFRECRLVYSMVAMVAEGHQAQV